MEKRIIFNNKTLKADSTGNELEFDGAKVQRANTYDPTNVNGDAFDMDNMVDGSTKVAMTTAERTKLSGINNPMLFKGSISVNTDFPLIADVQNGWTYEVQASVTDDAGVTYTNTLQSFESGDEITWNGADWTNLGNSQGDMLKSVYDTNDDGTVDDADALEGQTLDQVRAATVEEVTDLTYTFVLGDRFKTKRFNNGSAQTITVPLNSNVAFPVDTRIDCIAYGAGAVSFTPEGGVTIRSKDSNLTIDGQYSAVTLLKIATDEWLLIGALTA